MGCSSEQEGDCYNDEKPVHNVTVRNFYISKYEVTQKQWQLIMGTTIRQQRAKANGYGTTSGEGDNYPMYYVNWDDAQEFIRRLNEVTGKQYSLPTEAEWEYAARGGDKSRGYKYSGGNSLSDVAWYRNNTIGDSTHPVGTKRPNELGIYDMSGNVDEWCLDKYGDYLSSQQSNPMGAPFGSLRILRGGSWANLAAACRLSIRYAAITATDGRTPNDGLGIHGFRLVLIQ